MTETSTHTLGNGATKRLERSRSDRKLAGVCGGLARYFDIHPAVYRVGFVVLTLLGGAGILIYLAAALVMPDEGQEDSFATAALRNRRDRPWPLIGLGLVAVALVTLLSRATLWPHGDAWILLLIAGAAILWITRQGTAATADAATLATEDSRRIATVHQASWRSYSARCSRFCSWALPSSRPRSTSISAMASATAATSSPARRTSATPTSSESAK